MAEPGLLRSRLALAWLVLGEWRWHPGRFVATAVAIAVGVALGFAVHLVNGSALASFEQALTGVNGAADLQIRARTPLGFDERLYPRVVTTAGVADASPVVSLPARRRRAFHVARPRRDPRSGGDAEPCRHAAQRTRRAER